MLTRIKTSIPSNGAKNLFAAQLKLMNMKICDMCVCVYGCERVCEKSWWVSKSPNYLLLYLPTSVVETSPGRTLEISANYWFIENMGEFNYIKTATKENMN